MSFTGSTTVGRMIARVAGERLAKVCLELGGKNPLIVCDDADLEKAAGAAALSAFSNAGQRCAAGSRIIVFDAVYDRFRELLVERARAQRVGPRRRRRLRAGDQRAPARRRCSPRSSAREAAGATVLAGGARGLRSGLRGRLLHGADASSRGSPRTRRSRAPSCSVRSRPSTAWLASTRRVRIANASPYGLTAAIWTASLHRGQEFARSVVAGGVQVNGPTYGFEPHMPFGGLRESGHGLARAGDRGARRVLRLEDRVRHARAGGRFERRRGGDSASALPLHDAPDVRERVLRPRRRRARPDGATRSRTSRSRASRRGCSASRVATRAASVTSSPPSDPRPRSPTRSARIEDDLSDRASP